MKRKNEKIEPGKLGPNIQNSSEHKSIISKAPRVLTSLVTWDMVVI